MVVFFKKGANLVIAVETTHRPDATEAEKLSWLFGGATLLVATSLKGRFIGPRREMRSEEHTSELQSPR